MGDVIELILGTLAVVLCGAAFALGGQVLRQAWRAGFTPQDEPPPPSSAEGPAAHQLHPPHNDTLTKKRSP